MRFLSIQSWVTYGHVGNAAAIFPLQRLGHEVSGIHTVQFSNHLGYGAPKGRIFDAQMVDDIVAGLDERGMLGDIDVTLSGYLGSVDLGQAVLDAVRQIRAHKPDSLYCCDPVMGDVGRGIYVRAGLPEFFRAQAMQMADILTPNHFELEQLSGVAVYSTANLKQATRQLHKEGPRVVLVTSFVGENTPADQIDMVASGPDGMFLVRTPKFDRAFSGSGDMTAALFSAHWVQSGGDTAYALSLCASSIFCILQKTIEMQRQELAIIAAQEQLIAPDRFFKASSLEG